MSGTKSGGRLAYEKNVHRYGKDFYRKIGAMGGRVSKSGGFASDEVGEDGLTGRQRAAKVGAIGGAKSRRTK